ncbi:MAG TPA: ATP-binding cassette domain-containing protein [Opitutaceae bacterium]|nr:ATP-binding cassette domain-containing protein [Opitutaceae bacterium]
MNIVECENLTRRFGKTLAVDQINLQIPVGSIFALLGENGAGKSTTLKLLLNLLQPTSGKVTIFGQEMVRASKEIFQRIGYLSEDLRQPDWMTLPAFLRYCRSFYDQWDDELEATLRKAFRLPENRPFESDVARHADESPPPLLRLLSPRTSDHGRAF